MFKYIILLSSVGQHEGRGMTGCLEKANIQCLLDQLYLIK